MDPADTLFFIDLLHLVCLFILVIFCMAYMCRFWILEMIFDICMYPIFWEIIRVLRRGVITFEKEIFSKALFLPTHTFCFAPLQVLGRRACWWLTRR